MITAAILIYSALLFALGVIVGQLKGKGEFAEKTQQKKFEYNSEILNFLNYDGTEQ